MKDETKRVLLIQRMSDGLFWAPAESEWTTAPGWVKDPAYAKQIIPFDPGDFDAPKLPTHYVENSDRMRHWLKWTRTISAWIRVRVEVKLVET